ncbi:Transmembrane gtpase mfn mitofusin 1 fzo [Fasciola gigantica]|uniref:Transmembrane gtpase mfn mitofusin 1 fzo n=1 Tax=Fasciola gigantica TaxID=46835 RepID=A0A504YLQ1_FASGI|nr:Transmembrane gtpase mfn mitofusin 1 fzo [Fasciola gigantica]
MSAFGYTPTGDARQKNAPVSRQFSHPHLNKFKEAKLEMGKIYEEILIYMCDCQKFTDSQWEEKFLRLLGVDTREEVEKHVQKVKSIQGMISRNQMKCAFFGRTSNGKSTVINAMLGSKLLPAGLGHTTSCFLEIQGTDQELGYLTTTEENGISGSREHNEQKSRPIESISQLAHALSGVKLASDSLIRIYWPSTFCRLLREDVCLLDSPGINVDPDMDRWIDLHCLDADVFILVANAESTLMQAEKDFFHRVSQRLSKPNIFIINNRWDASANEMEYINEVRDQHMQRCIAFLVDELKVCSRTEAEEHVFFVSAREALAIRSKNTIHNGPPGSANNLGSPLPATQYMAEGWQERLQEFCNFEAVFEKTLSESATRTKFATHCEQGKQIAEHFRNVMEKVYETTVEEKDAAVRLRCLSQSRLEEVRARLVKTNQTLDDMIHTCLARVEAQVSSALNAEIRRLGELVDSYSRPFHPDPAMLHLYKRELNTHVERELGRKLTEACSSDILNEVSRAEQLMTNSLAKIVSDETHKSRIYQLVDPTAFTPEFHVDCRNLCADFREDIQFRFSLGLSAILQRLSTPRRGVNQYVWSSFPSTSSSYGASSGTLLTHSASWTIDLFPSLLSRNSVGAVIIFGLVSKAVGWRVLGLAAGLYGGLYLYERIAWTNKAKEATFKRQYVDFASHKLRLIVDLTSTNARHQVKRELQVAQKKLAAQVETFAESLVDEVKQLDEDIVHLETITTDAKKLKNRASQLLTSLGRFYDLFIANLWHEPG